MSLKMPLLIASLLSIVLSDSALAEPSAKDPFDFSLTHLLEIENIVVTAQKRSEFSQHVPISITSFDADMIKDLGFKRIWDIAAHSPNVDIKTAYGNSNPVITIRGVGINDVNSNNNPSVGVYVDEVYLGSSSMLGFPIFDMDRIDVLKGPQGTLYGRNTTSGAINFSTTRPSFYNNTFNLDLSKGNYAAMDLSGAWNRILINDKFAMRLAFYRKHSEGHIDNTGLRDGDNFVTQDAGGNFVGLNPDGSTFPNAVADNYGGADIWAWRASFTWVPSDTLNFFLSFHRAKDNSEGWLKDARPIGNPDLAFPDFEFFLATADEDKFCEAFINNASSSAADCAGSFGFFADDDPYTVSADTLPTIDNDNFGFVLHTYADFGSFSFTSVTSWEDIERKLLGDFDNQPQRIITEMFDDEITQVTQELRLSSTETEHYSWIVGLYYSKDEVDAVKTVDFPILFNSAAQQLYIQESTSTSIFTHTEWQLTDPLRLVIGLRYTNEDKSYDGQTDDLANLMIPSRFTNGTVPVTVFEHDQELKYEDVSGKIGLNYTFNENMMGYVSLSKGFKSGGFDGSVIFNPDAILPFDSEIVKVVEVGWKSMFMERSMQLNAVAYAYKYQDMQLQKFRVDGDSIITNAGEADISGVDIEYWWRPAAHMDVRIGYGYTNAILVDFDGIQEDIDRFEGNDLPNSPKHNFNGSFHYEWPDLLQGMDFATTIDFSYQDSTYKALENIKLMQSNAYTLINARAGLMTKGRTWELYVWGKNLTDKAYITDTTDTHSRGASYGVLYGMPRTLGLGVSFRFEGI